MRRNARPSPSPICRKRTKARILWMSRRTAFSIASKRRTSGSEAIFSSVRLRAHPPQHAVKQSKALRIVVAENGLGAFHELAGNVGGCVRRLVTPFGRRVGAALPSP